MKEDEKTAKDEANWKAKGDFDREAIEEADHKAKGEANRKAQEEQIKRPTRGRTQTPITLTTLTTSALT